MIIDFKIKNFMSFRDECNLTMRANSDKSHTDNLIEVGDVKYSKTKMIYGANASGKSSLFIALDFIHGFIINSNTLLDKMTIPVRPYKFRPDYASVPSEFSIAFIKDGLKYLYAFSCTQKAVISEFLDIYYTAKPTRVFTRTNTRDYKFNVDDKIQRDNATKNLDNKLFLVTQAAWNYERVKPVVDFLLHDIFVVSNVEAQWKEFFDEIMQNGEYDEFRKFCLSMLSSADVSIDDFSVKTEYMKDMGEEQFNSLKVFLRSMTKCSDEDLNQIADSNVYSFTTIHNVADGVETSRYELQLTEESLGTLQVFYLAPILYHVFKEGKTLFVDEIDRSLHPLLVEFIVKLFHNDSINAHGAQLIANTHDTNLLDMEIFRRDEIIFTERDYKTGATTLYPLSDFSPRTSENIERAYLLGRFGGIPFIKG